MGKQSLIADLQAQIDALGCGESHGDLPHPRVHTDGPARSSDNQRAVDNGSDADRAFKKIIALVNASDKSQCAIRQRLLQDGFDESAADEAIERARGYGFINDARFADVLIRSRLSQGKGAQGIARELERNEIDPDSVQGWPYDYGIDEESECQRALELLRRKPPRSKNQRDGAYRKLMQKGFSSSVASSAAREWFDALR